MRTTAEQQTGGAGLSEVAANFQRIGWGPVPNTLHDLGIDLFVQARDDRLFDRGLLVPVQVKAGDSWFYHVYQSKDGPVLGWWYYEPGFQTFR